MTGDGPKDLAALLQFGGGRAREDKVRAQRLARFEKLAGRLDSLTEAQAHEAITMTAIGSNQKQELRRRVEAKFGRSYAAWKLGR